MDGGLGSPLQDDGNPDTEQGYFRNVTMQRTNVTIAYMTFSTCDPTKSRCGDGATGARSIRLPFHVCDGLSGHPGRHQHRRQKTAYGSLRRNFIPASRSR